MRGTGYLIASYDQAYKMFNGGIDDRLDFARIKPPARSATRGVCLFKDRSVDDLFRQRRAAVCRVSVMAAPQARTPPDLAIEERDALPDRILLPVIGGKWLTSDKQVP